MICPKCKKRVSVIWNYKDIVKYRKDNKIFDPLPYWGYPELCFSCKKEL